MSGVGGRDHMAEKENAGMATVLLVDDAAFKTYVTVPLTSKSQCKNGGWRNFPQFRNQGQCVSFVERQSQT